MGLFKRRYRALQIGSDEQFDELVGDGRPLLADFYRYGCQPCRVMDGIVDEIAEEFRERANVVKVDLDRVPGLFTRFKVRSTPTFVLVTRQGSGLHQRWRHSGMVKKDVIVGNLERAIGE